MGYLSHLFRRARNAVNKDLLSAYAAGYTAGLSDSRVELDHVTLHKMLTRKLGRAFSTAHQTQASKLTAKQKQGLVETLVAQNELNYLADPE